MRSLRRGLTLIELLIIIVIIGILLAVAIPKFNGRRDKERLGALRADIRNAQKAEDTYFDQFKRYGTTAELVGGNLYRASLGDSITIVPDSSGYHVTATNAVDPGNVHRCTMTFAGAAVTNPLDCD